MVDLTCMERVKKMVDCKLLRFRNPELFDEIHLQKNRHIDIAKLTYGSKIKIWWVCKKGHEWLAPVYSRSKGAGCPKCSRINKLNRESTSLLKHNPTLAAEWHPTKNKGLKPSMVPPFSSKVVWWKGSCSHEWEAKISNRNKGTGCPYCFGGKSGHGNTLGDKYHKISSQWHPTKNGDLTPFNVRPYSNLKVWWKCDFNHEWEAIVESRINGTGCPKCKSNISSPSKLLNDYFRKMFNEVYTEYLIGDDLVDFYVKDLNLVVEYDGSYYHKKRVVRDVEKSNSLIERGFNVIRVRAMESRYSIDSLSNQNFDTVCVNEVRYYRPKEINAFLNTVLEKIKSVCNKMDIEKVFCMRTLMKFTK